MWALIGMEVVGSVDGVVVVVAVVVVEAAFEVAGRVVAVA